MFVRRTPVTGAPRHPSRLGSVRGGLLLLLTFPVVFLALALSVAWLQPAHPADAHDAANEGVQVAGMNSTGTAAEVSITGVSAPEGHPASFLVRLDGAIDRDVTVQWQTGDDTAAGANPATAGEDYTPTATAQTLTIPAGSVSFNLSVPTLQDAIDEYSETFLVRLSHPTNATLSPTAAVAVGTIDDDDVAPTVSIADAASVTEGAGPGATTDMTFTVSLSAVSGKDITVHYSLGGTATAGSDYDTPDPLAITIPAGQQTGDIVVPVKSDELDEDDSETVVVYLLQSVNADLSTQEDATVATGIIADPGQGLIPEGELDGPQLGEAVDEVSVTDYLGPDGVYRMRDGDGELELRLLSSSGAHDALVDGDGQQGDVDLEALAASAGAAYAPASSGDLNGTETTTVATPSTWLAASNGQLFLLVGGVNVFFAPHLDESEITAILAGHNIPGDRVEPLGELPNAYLIRTVSDLETLRLADALSAEAGVDSAVPNLYTPLSEGPELLPKSYSWFTRLAQVRCGNHKQYPDALSGCLWHLNADTNYRFDGKDPTIDINLGDAWASTMGAGVTVAVIDHTWESSHPDLVGNADTSRSKLWGGRTGEDGTKENAFHGTAVAGIVAARDNSIGGRGVAPRATLVNYNFLDEQSTANEFSAMTLNKETVAVYNLSYGLSDTARIMRRGEGWRRAVEEGLRAGFGGKGSSYVVAAGNGGRFTGADWATLDQQNNHRGVIAVCAVNLYGTASDYSEKGPSLWVCAPSDDTSGTYPGILTTIGKGNYMDFMGGTSAAAPMVSGVIALMRGVNDQLTWRDVKVILANTAQKNDPSNSGWVNAGVKYGSSTEKYSFNNEYGFGTVDASAAVQAASNWNLLPSEQLAQVSSSTVVALPSYGNEVELTADVTTDIDFVEHVTIAIKADIYDMRHYRWTLVSPSGTESLLSPEYLNCERIVCNWTGTFHFGSNRHLGEDGSGTWKVKVRRYEFDVTVCGIPDLKLHSMLCRGLQAFDEEIESFKLVVYGHAAEAGQAVQLAANPLSVAEGGEVNLSVRVEGAAPTSNLVLPLRFTDGETTAPGSPGADYAALASITIPAGATSATAKVATTQDSVYEGDETFTIALGALPPGFKRAGAPVTVTIADDDTLPTVTLKSSSATVTEGESVSITASLSNLSDEAVMLTVSAAPVAPAAAGDGSLATPTLTIAAGAGDSTGNVTFTATDNDLYELSTATAKRFAISATTSGGRGVADPASITVEIEDDESKPEVSITAGAGVTEGSDATFTLTATPKPADDLTVNVSVAVSGDYGVSAGTQTVTITTSGGATLTLATTGDQVDEPDGSITATIQAGADYTPSSTTSATVDIADDDTGAGYTVDPDVVTKVKALAAQTHHGQSHVNRWNRVLVAFGEHDGTGVTGGAMTASEAQDMADQYSSPVWDEVVVELTALEAAPHPPTPEVSIASGSDVTEGGDVTFTLTASPAPTANLDVTVTIATVGDYGVTVGSRTVTIPTSGSKTLTVATTDDQAHEADGSVTATLVDGADYDLGTSKTASVTVSDDDPPPMPVVSISGGSAVTEGASATFTLTANPAPAASLSVSLLIGKSGDFGVASGFRTVAIPTGGNFSLTIPTTGDLTDEADGFVSATLRDGSTYDLGTSRTAKVTILDDDDPPQTPVVSISGGSAVNEGGNVSFELTATPKPTTNLDVTVTIASVGDYGVTAGNRMVTIPISGSKTLTISTTDDQADESDGSVTATLVDGSDYDLGTSKMATVTVSDDDGTYTVDPDVVARVRELASQTQHGAAHVNRWNRVLLAFGEHDGTGVTGGPMTAAQAQDMADRHSSPVWDEVVVELTALEAASAQTPPPTPEVSISAGSGVTEGGSATFTVTASPAPAADLAVSVTVSQSGDYGATTGQRTVTVPTTGSVTLTVGTTDDDADETDGSVTATVNAGSGYTVSSSQGAATVAVSDNDDAPTPVVSITGGSGVTEGGDAVFTVTASPAPAANLAVSVTVSQSGDYGATTGKRTVTVPTTGSVTLTVGTTDDAADETDGSVTATVNAGSGYTVSSTQGAATVGVSDNDAAPTPVVSVSGGSGITEGGDAVFTVTASPAPAANLAVSVTVSQSGDYGATTGQRTVTIPTTGIATLTVGTTDDNADETDGSVTATVNAGSGYTVSSTQGAATVAVADNDDAPTPVVSITGGSGITEGGDAVFTVTASPAPSSDLAVSVTVSQSGDYGAATGQRTVTVPTTGSATLTVGTTDDNADETDGSVTATVNAGSGYTVSSSQGAATVAVADNDDAPTPVVSVSAGGGVTEGGDAVFTVTASPAPAADLAVSVTVSQSGDYGATTGQRTVTIPTTGSATLTVGTTDDAADEADGSVTATVNAGSGYTVSSTQGAATVAVSDDDDAAPEVEISVAVEDASAVEGDVLEFRVVLSAASAEEIRVRWYTAPAYHLLDDRAHRSDYQTTEGELVFKPGVTELTGEVWLEQDEDEEPDEYFAVEAFLPGSLVSPDAVGTMTIVDDD